MNRWSIVVVATLLVAACDRSGSMAPQPASNAAPSPTVRAPRAPRGPAELAVRGDSANDARAATMRLEDLVRADDTYDSLRARFGTDVVRETLPGGEGEEVAGWVLFPKDPTRRIEIYPDEAGTHPASMLVREPSTWVRTDGVHAGMTSTDLAALNGRPFVFAGFGWDYGGVVTDWKGGALAHGGRFVGPVTLCEPDNPPEDYPSGDRDFDSDLPVLKTRPAKVCNFGVTLDALTR